jgi:hypothetical protein
LDRFVTLQWDIDSNVEESLAIGHMGVPWLGVVRMVREYVESRELRVVVSPRATQRGAKLLAAGLDFNDVLHMALLSQFPADEKKDLHVKCHTAWREAVAVLPSEEESADEAGETPDIAGNIVDGPVDGDNDSGSPEVDESLPEIILGFVANAVGINEAYELMFGTELFNIQLPTDSTQLALTITDMMDDATRWQTLKVLFDMDNETRLNDKLKIAVTQILRNLEWDLRPFAKAN